METQPTALCGTQASASPRLRQPSPLASSERLPYATASVKRLQHRCSLHRHQQAGCALLYEPLTTCLAVEALAVLLVQPAKQGEMYSTLFSPHTG